MAENNNEKFMMTRTVEYKSDEEYIKERLTAQKEWFSKKSRYCQKKYKFYQTSIFVLSALIPFLITLSTTEFIKTNSESVPYDFLLQMLVALIGVAVAILTKVSDLQEWYKLWKDYRVTAETLKHEQLKYATGAAPYGDEDAFENLVERIEDIIAKDVQKWKQSNKKKDS